MLPPAPRPGLPSPPLLKVCGFTRGADVALAAELGVWAVGFIFAPSRRGVTPGRAAELIRSLDRLGAAGPVPVGVFADASPEDVLRTVRETGVRAVQLHGSEGPQEVAALRRALPEVMLIKTLGLPPATAAPGEVPSGAGVPDTGSCRGAGAAETLLRTAAPYLGAVDLILLDTAVKGRAGGTGRTFDWSAARRLSDLAPVLVAGGLTPENAARALEESGAWGIDVAGGVEAAPGRKDAGALRRLVRAVGGTEGERLHEARRETHAHTWREEA